MKIRSLMNARVVVLAPEDTIENAAKAMKENDVGCLPVGKEDRLVGMLTDRDIVIRGTAEGRGPSSLVRDLMSGDVKYCYDDEEAEAVAKSMASLRVRRLPVINRDKRLVGIVSLANFSQGPTPNEAQTLLKGTAQPHSSLGTY